jgi:hypothetical protein
LESTDAVSRGGEGAEAGVVLRPERSKQAVTSGFSFGRT